MNLATSNISFYFAPKVSDTVPMDYSSHDNGCGFLLELDRNELLLQITLSGWSSPEHVVTSEFNLSEAEEIAASLTRICANIRKARTT